MSKHLSTVLLMICAGGCASAPKPAAEPVEMPPMTPIGSTRVSTVRAAVLPLGVIPYDGFSLPLVRPDGSAVVTQSGAPPEWATVLAAPGAEPPIATRVEVYRLLYGEGRAEVSAAVVEPVVLGRGADARGFLVESPRDDGSRWIGLASWDDGSIRWLVQDESVNAFATMGPEGQLAWSRRAVDSPHFELVVRHADGREWTIAGGLDDLLMPTWSGRGDGLFLLDLHEGHLELAWAIAADAQTFRQTLLTIVLAEQATVRTAYQTFNGQPAMRYALQPETNRIAFYHPQMRRVAVWQPTAEPGRELLFLEPGSLTAEIIREDMVLVSTQSDLLRQGLRNLSEVTSIQRGLLIPRRTENEQCPLILLTPREREVTMVGMQLLE